MGGLAVETAESAYRAGHQMRVPLMIGTNSNDFIGLVSADSKDALFAQFGANAAWARAVHDPDGTATLQQVLTMVGADRAQAEPARFTAHASRAPGVPHGGEIPFVFDTLAAHGTQPTAEDSAVARLTNTSWANFARTGDPNGGTVQQWRRPVVGRDSITDIRPEGTIATRPDPARNGWTSPRPRAGCPAEPDPAPRDRTVARWPGRSASRADRLTARDRPARSGWPRPRAGRTGARLRRKRQLHRLAAYFRI